MKIVIVEDDELARIGLSSLLGKYGTTVEYSQGRQAIGCTDLSDVDLAFIDLDLEEDLIGLEVLNKYTSRGVYCVVLTGREEREVVTNAYELGAKDFLVKPIDIDTLDAVLSRYRIEKKLLEDDGNSYLSSISNEIKDQLRAYPYSTQPILVTGESGTGKTKCVSSLYNFFLDVFEREDFPFVSLNSSALSENLLESELFGYKKGAFTGAEKDKIGLIEKADGGVLFLDEVATLSKSLQKKLLKVIEEKEFMRVGDTEIRKSDFLLISATCENLSQHIEEGSFREDLFHRLNGLEIRLPAFRDLSWPKRKEALSLILKSLKRRIVLTLEAEDYILNCSWPGNFREIKSFVNRLSSLGVGVINKDIIYEQVEIVETDSSVGLDGYFDGLIPCVEEMGLPNLMTKLESFMVNSFYLKNNNKSRKTIEELRISNNLFYKYIRKK